MQAAPAAVSPRPGTNAYHLKRIGKGTFTKRLQNIGYDLDRVPRLLCDALEFVPMDEPYMIDFLRDHAVDKKTLDKLSDPSRNPFTKELITTIPTDMVELQREIEGIKRQPFYARLKLQKIEYVKLSDLKDVLKYSLEHDNHTADKKIRLENQLQEIETSLQTLDSQLRHKEIPVKETMDHLLRLEQQLLMQTQHDEFIAILEGIYCLQIEITQLIAKPVEEKTYSFRKTDVLQQYFLTSSGVQIDEIEKCKAVIVAKKSLMFEIGRFIRLTEVIIDSEHKIEDEVDHASNVMAKKLEKMEILSDQHKLVQTTHDEIEQWSSRQAQLQQSLDLKKERLQFIENLMANNPQAKENLLEKVENCFQMYEQSGVSQTEMNASINRQLKAILYQTFTESEKLLAHKDHTPADEKSILDLLDSEMAAWTSKLQAELHAIQRKNEHAKIQDKIARMELELDHEITMLIFKLKENLKESGLSANEIDSIINDQMKDIKQSENIVNLQFALLTELESYFKISSEIGESPAQHLETLLAKIHEDLRFLVPKEKLSEYNANKSGPFRLAFFNRLYGMNFVDSSHLISFPAYLTPGLCHLRFFQNARHPVSAAQVPMIELIPNPGNAAGGSEGVSPHKPT
jgi:hypothetical protein